MSCFLRPTVQNPKILILQLYKAEKKQQILTLEKLEPENVCLKYLSIIKIMMKKL